MILPFFQKLEFLRSYTTLSFSPDTSPIPYVDSLDIPHMNLQKLSSIISLKIPIMNRWKVPGALHNPKGIFLKANVPKGQVNVVFS